MFENDASLPGHDAAGPRRARTSGPGAASAPAAPAPTTNGDAGLLERALVALVAGSVAGCAEIVGAGRAAVDRGVRHRTARTGSLDMSWPGQGSRPRTPGTLRAGPGAAGRDGAGAVALSRPGDLGPVLEDAPGPEVAAGLADLDPADLDDLALVECLAAWERLAAWAQAGSARMLAELLDRARGSARHEFVVDEVAARLGLSRPAAARHVTVAHGARQLPEVADAMASGEVDRRKAEALVATGRLPDEVRRDVVAQLRPDLEQLTVRQIRDRLRRAEIAEDPDGAEDRRRRARRERSVTLEPVDDAMAYLTAYLPADDAARVFAAVEGPALAQHRTPGEERRLDECRADTLVALLTGRMAATGEVSAGREAAARPSDPGHGPVPVQVTVAASTLLGTDDLPAILAGYGPIPAEMGRCLATDPEATWQRLLTDPQTGVLTDRSSRAYRPSARLRAAVTARDATCTFPGCQVPARRGDLDHVDPFDPAADRPQTHGDNLHALCRTHHRAKTIGGWGVERDPVSGVTVWSAPSGGRYVRTPHPAHPAHTAPGRPPDATPSRDTGPPPF